MKTICALCDEATVEDGEFHIHTQEEFDAKWKEYWDSYWPEEWKCQETIMTNIQEIFDRVKLRGEIMDTMGMTLTPIVEKRLSNNYMEELAMREWHSVVYQASYAIF